VTNAAATLRLVRPGHEHLAAYLQALGRGWSPDNLRGAAAAEEQRAQIGADPDAFLALMDDVEGAGPPVTLPDGSVKPRLPSLRRWMWDDGCGPDGFAGTIGLRWTRDGSPLPPHVLGHIGYAVVPWQQRRGFATRALALMLEIARGRGLLEAEITTDPDNLGSQRVIEANGGRLVEVFDKGAPYGHAVGWRYRIDLTQALASGLTARD
jgi:predicted acetyltransferase